MKLSEIKEVKLYDLKKSSMKSKLLWIKFKEKQNLNSAVLMTICENNFNILKQYKKDYLEFSFNELNQKGYLLNLELKTINYFTFDPDDRIQEEKYIKFSKNQ